MTILITILHTVNIKYNYRVVKVSYIIKHVTDLFS